MIRIGDKCSFAGSIEVRQKVKDSSEQGYHFEIVSKPARIKGKLGDISNLSVNVRDQDGTIHPVPFKIIVWGEDERTVFYPFKLPDKTDWKGTELVITKKGKTIDKYGTASLDGTFLPVVLKDGDVTKVAYRNLKFGRK